MLKSLSECFMFAAGVVGGLLFAWLPACMCRAASAGQLLCHQLPFAINLASYALWCHCHSNCMWQVTTGLTCSNNTVHETCKPHLRHLIIDNAFTQDTWQAMAVYTVLVADPWCRAAGGFAAAGCVLVSELLAAPTMPEAHSCTYEQRRWSCAVVSSTSS